MLTSKQRATLRSLSNDFQAIMQVGKGGVNENMVKTVPVYILYCNISDEAVVVAYNEMSK